MMLATKSFLAIISLTMCVNQLVEASGNRPLAYQLVEARRLAKRVDPLWSGGQENYQETAVVYRRGGAWRELEGLQ